MALREHIAADIRETMESDPIIKDRLTRTGQLFNPGGPAGFGASIDAAGHRRGGRHRARASGQAVGVTLRRRERRRTLVGQAAVGDVPWCCLPQCGQYTLIGYPTPPFRFSDTSSISDRIGLLV